VNFITVLVVPYLNFARLFQIIDFISTSNVLLMFFICVLGMGTYGSEVVFVLRCDTM